MPNECQRCRHWEIAKPLDQVGDCQSVHLVGKDHQRWATEGCDHWLPIWRELGELRKPPNWKYIRYSAARTLYERGLMTMEQAMAWIAKKHSAKEMQIVRSAAELCWGKAGVHLR